MPIKKIIQCLSTALCISTRSLEAATEDLNSSTFEAHPETKTSQPGPCSKLRNAGTCEFASPGDVLVLVPTGLEKTFFPEIKGSPTETSGI